MIKYSTDTYGRANGKILEARINPNYKPDTHDPDDKYHYNPRTESLTKPPELLENESAFLIKGKWVKKIDRMGQYYYEQNGTKIEITEFGIDIPEGCLQIDPESTYHKTHDGINWIEDLTAKWVVEIAATDKDFPRFLEDLYDANPSLNKGEWVEEKYKQKKFIRDKKPK